MPLRSGARLLPGSPEVAAYRASAAAAAPDAGTIDAVSERLRKVLAMVPNLALSFQVDDTTKKLFLRIENSRTGEVVREIPSESVRELDQHLDALIGVLLDAHL